MSIEGLMLDTGMDLSKMTPFESKCYGMSEAEIRHEYMNSPTAERSGLEMVMMGVLSDCQEMLNLGDRIERAQAVDNRVEAVRKQLNVVKFMLSEMMDEKRGVSA